MKKFLFVICAALLLGACAQQSRVVTVTEYRDRVVTDTVDALRIDSVYIAHYVREKGDTVHMIDTVLKYKILHDVETLREYVHDSIPYAVEVQIPVRQRNGYDRFTSWGFWILLVLVVGRIAWWVFKTFYLRKG